jgi:hypothetical protein
MLKSCSLAGFVLLLVTASASAGGLIFKKSPPPLAPDFALPLDEMSEAQRALAKGVLDRPTLSARGPSETFVCKPDQYGWILDNPDRAVTAWRRLGAKCVNIAPRGDGQYGWSDEHGGDVVWQTLYKTAGMRIWYAEGKARPTPFLPLVSFKAVLVLHYGKGKNAEGATVITHHTDLHFVTDSKTYVAVSKIMGQSAPRLAEQGLGQFQVFFSGLSWYLARHPDEVEDLLRQEAPLRQEGPRK